MTLEEIKKEIKKLIDKCNNDIYKYDDLHVNAQRSYTRSSAYKNYVESKGKRAGLQEALHIIEQLEDYDVLLEEYEELMKVNDKLKKDLEVLEILKKYLSYDNENHCIKMKKIYKSIYNFDYEDLKEWYENDK